MHTKYAHIICSRPTQKDVEHFRNRLVCKPCERSLYEWTFMSEPLIDKHAISIELSNVNREKHRCKSHRVCRPDREPSRIHIRSLKGLRNKSRKVRNLSMHVFFHVSLCHLHYTVMLTLKNYKIKRHLSLTVVKEFVNAYVFLQEWYSCSKLLQL